MAAEPVYCLCRETYDPTRFMIECDQCKDWFHGTCVGIKEHAAQDIENYHCPNCQPIYGTSTYKIHRNKHRHDYSEPDDPTKSVQNGTITFVRELRNRTFPSCDEVVTKMKGSAINTRFLEKGLFTKPILVEKKDGLGMSAPPSSLHIRDIEKLVGTDQELDVIDVRRQQDHKMTLAEFSEYYTSPHRSKVFNLISMEVSGTKLGDAITLPTVVRNSDWVTNYWPPRPPSKKRGRHTDDDGYFRPDVVKYCLVSVKDAYTDFHIDFGGTSVWYHILKGEKIFYLIAPSPANLSLYESWSTSPRMSEMFFGDQVAQCYKCTLKQGQTIFLPTGWIHAILTPIDSIVIGGNFLHNYNIPLQMQVHDMEKRIKTLDKFMFPSFEAVTWYTASHLLQLYKDKHVPDYLAAGLAALSATLKIWVSKRKYVKHLEDMPTMVDCVSLSREFSKLVKMLPEKQSKPASSRGQLKIKLKPSLKSASVKNSSLKLMISNGKLVSYDGDEKPTPGKESPKSALLDAGIDETDQSVNLRLSAPLPTAKNHSLRGNVLATRSCKRNSSESLGFTEKLIRLPTPAELNPALLEHDYVKSPTMRQSIPFSTARRKLDAMDGMLQIAVPEPLVSRQRNTMGTAKKKRSRKPDDEEKFFQGCFKDSSDYVYPKLDYSDEEETVQPPPQGQGDFSWNPNRSNRSNPNIMRSRGRPKQGASHGMVNVTTQEYEESPKRTTTRTRNVSSSVLRSNRPSATPKQRLGKILGINNKRGGFYVPNMSS